MNKEIYRLQYSRLQHRFPNLNDCLCSTSKSCIQETGLMATTSNESIVILILSSSLVVILGLSGGCFDNKDALCQLPISLYCTFYSNVVHFVAFLVQNLCHIEFYLDNFHP